MRGIVTSRIARSTSLARAPARPPRRRRRPRRRRGGRARASRTAAGRWRTTGWSSASSTRVTSGMVIDASSAGSRSATSVPCRSTAIRERAPTSSARSRMPADPARVAARVAGRPRPSSRDASGRRSPSRARSASSTRRRAGVARDVGQRLLGDAVDRPAPPRGERGRSGSSALDDPQPGSARRTASHSASSALCSPSSSSASGRRRLRDPPHVLRAAARRLAQLVEPAAQLLRSSAWKLSICRSIAVSVWPISSCSSRAIRRRSASCADSAIPALSRRSPSSRSSIALNAAASAPRVAARVADVDPAARRRAGRRGPSCRSARAAAAACAAGTRRSAAA